MRESVLKHLLTAGSVLPGILLLTSCSSTPPATGDQAEKIAMCKQQLPAARRIHTESVSMGCAASLAFNKMIGSNNPTPLLCFAGGTSGYLLGESIAERKCSYLTLEQQLDGEIAHAQKMNSGFQIVFAQQAKDLARYQAQAAALADSKAEDAARRTQLEQLNHGLQNQLDQDSRLLQQTRDEFRFKQETLETTRSLQQQDKSDKLLTEIRALQTGIKSLQANNQKLLQVKDNLTL
ncbi:MAG: hypothetical protein KDI15_08490 [Thiothrix sp.]|nr:hypothetical protein [Thiothrix sp.]HPE60824.1 hypothetical protein [Thiolinea sp.]